MKWIVSRWWAISVNRGVFHVSTYSVVKEVVQFGAHVRPGDPLDDAGLHVRLQRLVVHVRSVVDQDVVDAEEEVVVDPLTHLRGGQRQTGGRRTHGGRALTRCIAAERQIDAERCCVEHPADLIACCRRERQLQLGRREAAGMCRMGTPQQPLVAIMLTQQADALSLQLVVVRPMAGDDMLHHTLTQLVPLQAQRTAPALGTDLERLQQADLGECVERLIECLLGAGTQLKEVVEVGVGGEVGQRKVGRAIT